MEREEMLQRFEQYLRRRFPDRRTPIDYLSDVRQFAAQCSKAWLEVTRADLDAFVDQQRQHGLAPATVKRRVASLKTFFEFVAEETGRLDWPNPVNWRRHAGRQPHRLPRDLSDEQVERLWAVIPASRDRAWFALMLRAGLRAGEVVSLTPADLLAGPEADRPARLRVCGKGRKERVVLLTADAYAVVRAWLQERPASAHATLFLNERGAPLTVNGLEWLLGQYSQAAGVDATPHQLRHTFARQLTEAGMPVTSLSKLLGHADISTTQLYTAGADPELAQAYQTAMQRLSRRTPLALPPAPAAPVAPAPVVPAPPPVEPRPALPAAALPDWETWVPDLPSGIRQPCLDYVQRHLPTWKANRCRTQSLKVLGELARFWRWQLARRPLAQLADLRLADLLAYQTERSAQGKAAGTINVTLERVLALLHERAEQGHPVEASVFRLRALPRPDSLPRHLTEAESQQLETHVLGQLDSPDPQVRLENACFWVLAHTGLRASECVDLLVQDLDLPAGRLVVRQGKGQRDRVVYLSDTASQALTGYLAGSARRPDDPLWLKPGGAPITYGWLYERVVAFGEASGVSHLTPHRLRHTLATRLLNAGMDVTRIQKLLGHEQLNTTMIYARVLDTTVEADYRQAMRQLEQRQMPLSTTPEAAEGWPTDCTKEQVAALAKMTLDNSV